MKQKQPLKVEKRRPQVELNLIGEARARTAATARGCRSLLGRILVAALGAGFVSLGVLWPGLH